MKRNVLFLLVAICTLLSQAAFAGSDLGLKGIGGTVGIVDPDNVDATVGFGLLTNWGQITPDIRLESRLDYWSKSQGLFGGGDASLRDITLGARGKYFFHVVHSSVRPFAGSGLGLHFVRAKVSVPDQDLGGGTILPGFTVSDTTTKLGLDLGGGIETRLNQRNDFLAEAWYGLASDVDQFTLRVGFLHHLGAR
jgi:opacity protein-like surface antigen